MRNAPRWIGSRPVVTLGLLLLLLVLVYAVVLVDSRFGITDAQNIQEAIVIHLIQVFTSHRELPTVA